MTTGKIAVVLGLAILASVATFMGVQHKDYLFAHKLSAEILSLSDVSSHLVNNIQDLPLRVGEFNDWTAQFGKKYSKPEAVRRFFVWIENYNIVQETNAKNLSYTLGMNHFADLTLEEFEAMHLGFDAKQAEKDRQINPPVLLEENLHIPASVDWRQQGAIGAIRNQGQCGGCWAFAAACGLESLYKLKRGNTLPDFSEQQLIDCSSRYGNNGCNGGTMAAAFQYTQASGIQQESAYKFQGYQGSCRASTYNTFKNTGYQNLQQSYTQIQNAAANQPVTVGVAASSSVFQMYRGGVITSSGCGTGLNHAITIIGYATNTGSGNYWIVRNQWGTSWGESGYGKIAMSSGSGICGINMMATIPTL